MQQSQAQNTPCRLLKNQAHIFLEVTVIYPRNSSTHTVSITAKSKLEIYLHLVTGQLMDLHKHLS
uniref:Uncharacterized protein n=1 Tax=Arion vulgaris TaxID=1028688 RepID=A0A0B7B238_9EUPU